jgi:pimeloyl-ACP methyl ester carboxylesterase
MKTIITTTLASLLSFLSFGQNSKPNHMLPFDTIKIESHIKGLPLGVLHMEPQTVTRNFPVLFVHGSSFPSELSFGFRMDGVSWMDHFSERNIESFALDFLGYGISGRYPEMTDSLSTSHALGNADQVVNDIDRAVDEIRMKTGSKKLNLIGHSWGASVCALYAEKHPEKIESLVLFAPITKRDEPGRKKETQSPFDAMTPDERVSAMMSLTPAGEECQLAHEIYKEWQEQWYLSDPLAKTDQKKRVRFPSGPVF